MDLLLTFKVNMKLCTLIIKSEWVRRLRAKKLQQILEANFEVKLVWKAEIH